MNQLRAKQAASKQKNDLSKLVRKHSISGATKKRLTECHDFAWSRQLHLDAERQIAKVVAILVMFYLLVTVSGLYYDGYRGVDIPYLIVSSITTIGLGDLSPQTQLIRGGTILFLPLGLLIITFGLALVVEHSSHITSVTEPVIQTENVNKLGVKERMRLMKKRMKENPALKLWFDFKDSFAYPLFTLLAKYVAVIFIGASFMMLNDKENRLQKEKVLGKEMTLIDALYFSTVCATTVGYGHEIAPVSDNAKLFFVFYFLCSTALVGSIIGELSSLCFSLVEEEINQKLLESVIYVHKADMFGSGIINEAEYVVFKLLQLQKIDHDMLHRLCKRFAQLDQGNKGKLLIGYDIPSHSQVAKLKEMNTVRQGEEGSLIGLMALWKEKKQELIESEGQVDRLLKGGIHNGHVKKGDLTKCHNFSWSRRLWRAAALYIGIITTVLLLVYLGIQYYVTTHIDGYNELSIIPWYYLSATLSTVGFGDFAPTEQSSRASAIFMIPFGLTILGLILSFSQLYANSTPEARPKPDMLDAELDKLFKKLGPSYGGQITKQQFIIDVGVSKLKLSEKDAGLMFDNLDFEEEGVLFQPGITQAFFKDSIAAKCLILVAKVYGVIVVAGVFMKLNPREGNKLNLTWVDAFYFATVSATSVGYGDITPISDSGRIFFTFYMLVASVIVAGAFGDLLSVYLKDVVTANIHNQILDSSVWMHKADVDCTGALSESEYIIFKLMQMQAVDTDLLNRLMDHFEELDFNNTKTLIIGLNIPSQVQVKELEKLVSDPDIEHHVLNDAWEKLKVKLMSEMGLEEVVNIDSDKDDDDKADPSSQNNKLTFIAHALVTLQRARRKGKQSLLDVLMASKDKEEEAKREQQQSQARTRSISLDFAQLEMLSFLSDAPSVPSTEDIANMMPDMSSLPVPPDLTEMIPSLPSMSEMTGMFSSGQEETKTEGPEEGSIPRDGTHSQSRASSDSMFGFGSPI